MNKSMEIENRMRDYIRTGVWTADRRIPTELELCGHFGVSRTTVRTALNSLRSQGRLISRSARGTAVAGRETRRTLHLIVGSAYDASEAALMKNLVFFGGRHPELEVRLHAADGNSRREAAVVTELAAEPDSFILMTGVSGDAARKIIVDHPGRFVIIGSAPELLGVCCQVQTDVQAGVGMVMDHLIGFGHRRIAWFGPDGDGDRRFQYRACLVRSGIAPDDELSFGAAAGEDGRDMSSPQAAHRFLRRILEREDPATAVVCASNLLAVNLLHAALAREIPVPETLSIAGLYGIYEDVANLGEVSLTAAVRPFEELFNTALNLLKDFSGENPRVLVRPGFHIGNTVANKTKTKE